jgi:hypothetical protein
MSERTTARKHPSGRPIRRARYRALSVARAPRDEPLTPGLRHDTLADAIGFAAGGYAEIDEDDE